MKSHLTKPHHSYNNLDLGHKPAIHEVNDPGRRYALYEASRRMLEFEFKLEATTTSYPF